MKILGSRAVIISIIQRRKLNTKSLARPWCWDKPEVAQPEAHSLHDIRLSPHVAGLRETAWKSGQTFLPTCCCEPQGERTRPNQESPFDLLSSGLDYNPGHMFLEKHTEYYNFGGTY